SPCFSDVIRFNRTHSGNAELFAALFGTKVRYDHAGKRWLLWHQNWWVQDTAGEVTVLAKRLARWRAEAAFTLDDPDRRRDEFKWAARSESRHGIEATIKLAQSEPPIADDGKNWDSNPMLFGVANGVMNLRTGEIRPGRQSDRVTLHSDVVFDAKTQCPR